MEKVKARVTSDYLVGASRGDVIELDPAEVSIPALVAAGHVELLPPEKGKPKADPDKAAT